MESIKQAVFLFFEQIWAVIRRFNFFSDTLDILFIALVIYGLLRLIRQTRGVQLVKGLIWIAGAGVLVSLLNMEAAKYLFQEALMKNIVVLLLILFQPEIRNVFERLGRSNVSNLNFLAQQTRAEREREVIESAIHQVCEACRQFSAERTGALIVFERVTMLGDTIKTGTVIDAKVSRALIGNIFFIKAPLHDGAVIIRKGRVQAAGCILPLTQNGEFDNALGTRHRAALGMSEQSDALAAVVSEETGLISLAYKGVLRRGLSPEELGEALREALLDQELSRKKFNLKRRRKEGFK